MFASLFQRVTGPFRQKRCRPHPLRCTMISAVSQVKTKPLRGRFCNSRLRYQRFAMALPCAIDYR